jgi:predicted DNA-binding protein
MHEHPLRSIYKKQRKEVVSCTFSKETIERLNQLPRTLVPSRSYFIEGIVKLYLDQMDKEIDKKLAGKKEE